METVKTITIIKIVYLFLILVFNGLSWEILYKENTSAPLPKYLNTHLISIVSVISRFKHSLFVNSPTSFFLHLSDNRLTVYCLKYWVPVVYLGTHILHYSIFLMNLYYIDRRSKKKTTLWNGWKIEINRRF